MTLTRREFLVTAGAAAAARTQPGCRASALLIIADDQGLDLGCYGNRAISTPHIDAFAASAVRFTHGFATVSSCSSSRSVLYTGLFNHTSGQYGLAHDIHNQSTLDDVESLPRLLKAAGVATGVVGKLHVKPPQVYPFDYLVEGREIAGNRDVAAMARKVGEFLAATKSRPFLLVVGFSDPHRNQAGFANARSYTDVPKHAYDPAAVRVPAHLPDWLEVRQDLADYYESVTRLDHGVGMILRELEASGRARDTLVIYVSDNGIPFPGAKTTLYDAGIHLPLIVRAPERGRAGATTGAMASWIDVAPTILDWTGVARPSRYTLPGRSLLPALDEPRGWDEVYASHTFHQITMYYPMRAVRTRRHKYILNLAHPLPYPQASDILDSPTWKAIAARQPKKMGALAVAAYFQRPAEELYDVERDPNEAHNLAGDPASSAMLKELRAKMTAFRERTRDPWLVGRQAYRETAH
ncbi:MAG: sulfatase [Acidobacteria bacterium]|nr:sulfatase [Acidobacteriota bacterium]